MKMKNTKIIALSAMAGLMGTFASCSDSVVSPTPVVPDSYVSKGIETEVQGALVEIPVTCEGQWFAVADSSWVNFIEKPGQTFHSGTDKLMVSIEANPNRTTARRDTIFITQLNGGEIAIPVYQSTTYYGEEPNNGDQADFYNNNGIGCPVDYTYMMQPDTANASGSKKFSPTKMFKHAPIFNMATIESKKVTGNGKEELFQNSEVNFSSLNDMSLVNSISKVQEIDVKVKMAASFGFLEFEAEGKYSGGVQDTSTYVNYSFCRQAPCLSSNLNSTAIAELADDEMSEYEDKYWPDYQKYQKLYSDAVEANDKQLIKRYKQKLSRIKKCDFGNLFSSAFAADYWDLYQFYHYTGDELYPNKADWDAAYEKLLRKLDSDFGPYFISGGDFGGAFNLYAKVDKKTLNEDVQFNASITAQISEAFNFSGNVEFKSQGVQLYKNSRVKMSCYGGDAAKTLIGVQDFFNGPMTSVADLQSVLTDWVNSFSTVDKKADGALIPQKASPISFTLTPIWTLMNDVDVRDSVELYFKKAYKDKGIDIWSNVLESSTSIEVDDILNKLKTTTPVTTDDSSSSSSSSSSSGSGSDSSSSSSSQSSGTTTK